MWITVIYGGSGVGIYIIYPLPGGGGERSETGYSRAGEEVGGGGGMTEFSGRGWYDILFLFFYQTTRNALKISTSRKTGEITPTALCAFVQVCPCVKPPTPHSLLTPHPHPNPNMHQLKRSERLQPRGARESVLQGSAWWPS